MASTAEDLLFLMDLSIEPVLAALTATGRP